MSLTPPSVGTSSGRWRATTPWCRSGRSCSPTSRRRSRPTPSSSATAPGFLLESVEHGERWSRFSFVGRDPTATFVLRDGHVDRRRRRAGRGAADRGMLADPRGAAARLPRAGAARPAAAPRRRRRLPRLRRGARGRAPPRCAARRSRPARRGHERDREPGRLRPLASAGRTSSRACPSWASTTPTLDAAYDDAAGRLERAVADLGRPLPYTPVPPPDPGEPLPDVRSTMPGGLYQRAVEVAKELHPRRRHLPGRAGAALRPRARRRPVRRVPGAAPGQPQPVHVLPPPPRDHDRRLVTRADGAGARPDRSSPGPSPAPAGGAAPTRTTAGWPASCSEHPKEIAEHVMLVDLARNDVGRVAQFGSVHVDELMTLERYSHVMHLTSQVSGELRPGLGPDRRAAGHAAGGHGERRAEGAGHGDHRRARAGQARAVRRVSSATSTSRATSTPPSPSAPCSSARRARVAPGRRRDRGRQRSRPRGPRVPQQGRGAPGGGAGGAAHDGVASQGGGQR